LNGR
jgi:DNA-binding transcriptional ArsR family regulator